MLKKIAVITLTLGLFINSASFAVKDFVAHAGGSIHGIAYTNSLEALNNSYSKGFRTFELDMMRTSDGHLILAHDDTWALPLFISKVGPITYQQFKNSKVVYNLTLMDVHDLVEWLDTHQDATIILDKLDNDGYKYLSMTYPEHLNQFIPQIFKMDDLPTLKAMGYNKVLLTLYMANYTDKQIVGFMGNPDLYGITISYDSFKRSKQIQLNATKTKLYVHTINDIGHYFVVHNAGVYGIYTDYLEPAGLMPSIYASRVSTHTSQTEEGTNTVEEKKLVAANIEWDYAFYSVHADYKRYNGYAFNVIEKVDDDSISKYHIVLGNGQHIIALQSEIDGTYRKLEVDPRQ